MLKLSNIKFSYLGSSFQLNVESLEAKPGQSLAIIGPSGSGKTTLLNLISGIALPEQGSISFENMEINQLNDDQRRKFRIGEIGFIFQNFKLIDYLNVLDNILHIYRLNPALKLNKEVKKKAKALAESTGINQYLNKPVNNLSQGEKQRVAICRALLTSPRLILADEATGNLDPDNKKQVLDILLNYTKENNAALLAVTHDYELLQYFDDTLDFKDFYTRDKS